MALDTDDDEPLAPAKKSPLDSDKNKAELRKLLGWFYYERDRQSSNRLEQAMDADFYDGIQWSPEDAAALTERRQMPLVYNQIAPMVDWIIGTERRARVDWKVLPRAEDDVEIANVKTEVLKYIADVNHAGFERSRAFADAVKVGVGWVEDGARKDPTADAIFSRYEDWRCVLWDSASYQYDLSDARYLFRWKWVDADIAAATFPDRKRQIQIATETITPGMPEDGFDDITDDSADYTDSAPIYEGSSSVLADSRRKRVRLIECQYRKLANVKVIMGGPFDRAILAPGDNALAMAAALAGSDVIDTQMMRMHIAVFTESDLLSLAPSPYRHNGFTMTPIWCYRDGRHRLPYGAIRRARDIQRDLNKRASKALHIINTNQIIAEKGAVDDWQEARDEADDPGGTIITNPNKQFTLHRDDDQTAGHVQMMTLDAQTIQRTVGVNDENLGLQTNANSGEAIKARQMQGSVVTTEPFDNLRLAVHLQGQKQLSLAEQFYTQQKVIRLTGTQGQINWLKVNTPEQQPDGSVRFLNDITASAADFVVSDQDYSGTLRQVMFDSISAMSQKLPAPIGLRLLAVAMAYSDLPNHDEIAQQIRQAGNIPDPNQEQSPEAAAEAQKQAAQQADALNIQRQTAIATLQAQQAKTRELNARAAQMEANGGAQAAGMAASVQAQGSNEIERLSQKLQTLQQEVMHKLAAAQASANTAVEVARINADAKIQVAEITAKSNQNLDAIAAQVASMEPPNVEPQGGAQPPAASAPAQPPEPAAPAQPPAALDQEQATGVGDGA